MNYSAGMVSQVFAFVETKQTAELMAAGMSKDEIKDKVIGENLYQLRNETRLRRTFNYVYNRLSSLPDGAVELLVKVDNENAKLLTLIAIMNTDKLFFEFVYDVYRGKVILGEKTIEDRDINGFFDDKATQSEEVAGWSESGIKKLKNCLDDRLNQIEDKISEKSFRENKGLGNEVESICLISHVLCLHCFRSQQSE